MYVSIVAHCFISVSFHMTFSISSKFRFALKLVSSVAGFFNIVAKFSTRLPAGPLQSERHLHIGVYLIRISRNLRMRGRVWLERLLSV